MQLPDSRKRTSSQYTRLSGWPRLPIYLAQATGYRPDLEVVVGQAALAFVYALGATYMFVAPAAPRDGIDPDAAGRVTFSAPRTGGSSGRRVMGALRVGVDVGGTFTKAVAVPRDRRMR